MKLRRYLVFFGSEYYPLGGWADFKASFDTLEEALDYIKNASLEKDWYQVIDSKTGKELA